MPDDQPMFSVCIVRTSLDPSVVVRGELDLVTSPQLQTHLDHVIDSTAGDVVADLADVGYIDSTGLRTLLSAHDRLTQAGRHLSLRNPSVQVIRLLEICGVSDLVGVDDLNGDTPTPTTASPR